MLTVQEPYAKRPIRFLELWQEGDWRLKLYSYTTLNQVCKRLALGGQPLAFR